MTFNSQVKSVFPILSSTDTKPTTPRGNIPPKSTRPQSPSLSQSSVQHINKRPRLTPSRNKENIHTNATKMAHRKVMSPNKGSGTAKSSKAENDFMSSLMAGLDASMFDNFESSPIKPPESSTRPILSPTVKFERQDRADDPPQLSKLLSHSVNSSVVELESKFAVEDCSGPTMPNYLDAKLEPESDPVFVDNEDDLYDFDFDLADLSAFDDDLLMKPPPPKIRYPVLNPTVPSVPKGYKPTPWARCVIEAVYGGLLFGDGNIIQVDQQHKSSGLGACGGKTLVVTLPESGTRRVIHLRERWADMRPKIGDIVNIISPCLDSSQKSEGGSSVLPPINITFKDTSSFIIHHPDIMLTMTSIANAMPCPRKPLLQSLIKIPAPTTKPLLYGTILHSLLQSALKEQNFTLEKTQETLDKELEKEEIRMEIWGAGWELQDVKQEILEKAGKGFEVFGEKWVGAVPKVQGELHASPGENPSLLAINGLHDVEENIWSPKWGLKGKVDASVQAIIANHSGKNKPSDPEENVAPLEIKTGRSVGVLAHRAQTMLYTLLMEDRYAAPVPAGLLYYSQLDSILRVEAKQNEIRALIIARNELASFLARRRTVPNSMIAATPMAPPGVLQSDLTVSRARVLSLKVEVDVEDEPFLPTTIDNSRECRSCYAVDSCMLYRKTVDRMPVAEDDPIAGLYEDKTGHMTEKDGAFFRKWDTLLTVEEQEIGRFRSQLWTMNAKAREKSGRCFSDMIIVSHSDDAGLSYSKIHRHSYTFARVPHLGTQVRNPSLLSGHIAKGDPVSLSIEPDLLCLSRGFVTDLTESHITIAVTYVIDVSALLVRTRHHYRATSGIDNKQVVFRIDKDEMASGMMRMRSNLAQLFFAGGDEQRRRLIVDLDEPIFEQARLPLPSEIPSNLNVDQRKAMEKVMTARDYALILGMPGTGKTTTIAEIIKALVNRGKSVLLTSYTHSAVDTILMKLVNSDLDMLRLGNIDKVHPDVRHLTLEAYEDSKSMAALESRLMRPQVVAATCLAIEHPIFYRRKFDYCIVDEASQITLPTCLGPLRLAETFVLVGDHFQLPPIVRNQDAKRGGLDVSLFRLLSDAHPSAVVDLSHQYRMNEDIMCLSNRLIYEGKLKCGSEEVAKQALALPLQEEWENIHGEIGSCGGQVDGSEVEGGCWIDDLLQESSKAIFVDTDLVPALDSRIGDLVQNEVEAKLVRQLAGALSISGVKQQDIAVITPYRQQIKLFTGLFKDLPKIEILTADKSQGRDKDCILISLVRSNEVGNIGDLLRDWRRINVSFTRAKKKLIIFGSRTTLKSDKLLGDFFELMETNRWIRQLPRGAHEMHTGLEGLSDVSVSPRVKEKVKREKRKEGKVIIGGPGVLVGKPFAKEVFAGMS